MKTKIILSLAAVGLMGNMAFADLLVDRGLPTANLNNAAGPAGADRSNVSWAFTEYTSPDYWVVGDTFKNNSSQTWNINQITLWTVGQTDTAILRGGIDGSSIGIVSTAASISDATYAGGITYQGSSGEFGSTMHQIDFTVNILLGAGQTYDFFLDGTGNSELDFQGNPIVVPYVHASNAALSGSPQDGADGTMLFAEVIDGSIPDGYVGSWTSLGDGWDKASDVNVDVYGSSVPDGGMTITLLGGALMSLAALRRKLFC